MQQLQINGKTYNIISNLGSVENQRGSKRNVIRLDLDIDEKTFNKINWVDGTEWAILNTYKNPETEEMVTNPTQYSNYCLVCDKVIHADGKVSIYLGEPTSTELLESVLDDLLS